MPSSEFAWRTWLTCNTAGAGRDSMTGQLRIEAVIALLAATGGSTRDLDLVMLIESIHLELKLKQKKEKRDE